MNNHIEIRYAVEMGIHVKLLYSTRKAKEWIDRYTGIASGWSQSKARYRRLMIDFLRANCYGNKVRVITDLGRWEDGSLKTRAGEEIIQYFRNKDKNFRDNIQILLCSASVANTGFVEGFPSTYSTSNRKVVLEYIHSLAQGVDWVPRTRWAIT